MEAEAVQKGPRLTVPSPSSANFSQVLDNEDLLPQIITLIHDTPSFVRAALVCKKWYRICSHPEFLEKFCKRQPRHLLGYFASLEEDTGFFVFKEAPEQAGASRFLSISFPQSISQALDRRTCVLEEAPELTCVSRFLSSTFPEGPCDALDYRNGRVLLKFGDALAICNPLRQKVWMLPPLLKLPYWRGSHADQYFLLSDDGLSAVHVRAWISMESLGVEVGRINGDKWIHDSNSITFEEGFVDNNNFCDPALLVNGCIFMLTLTGCLLEVNLEGCEISKIDLPIVDWLQWGSHQLCRAQGTDLLYVNADVYNIQIWMYSQDTWSHCNTIHLPIVFAHSNMSWTAIDWDESMSGCLSDRVTIYGVDEAAEFMFLGVIGDDGLYLLDVGCSNVVKVGEKTSEEKGDVIGNTIIPLITSCPPVLPEMREDKIDVKTLENAVAEGNKMLIVQLLAISLDEQSVKNFIKTRYRSPASLIWSIDDCLTILHSVAALPAVEVGPVLQHRIHSCRRLTQQWEKYILQTSSLRKKVASVNGVYSQAEVNGQTVTWRSPLGAQVASDYFGINLSVNLLIFYENCLELLLESVNNRGGAFSEKRYAQLVLIPNFQYSETIKRLRALSDGVICNLEALRR